MNIIAPYSHQIINYLRRTGHQHFDPKAALIDMDGTLYDSMRNHSAAWYRLVTELGIEATQDEFYLYEGRTGASTINLIFNRTYGRDATSQEIEELYHRKTVYFTELPAVKPMDGAAEMLGVLEDYNITRVLVTGSGQRTLIDRLNNDFPGAFAEDKMITSRDVTKGKPDPEPYLMAMKRAGAQPWQSIVIENAPIGVEAGVRADAFTIGVNTGPIPRQVLEEVGADIVFDSMRELAESMPVLLDSLKKVSL
ncbi:MAG: HAD-IA family hydrolase [Lachnoclostridium sp.]|nr:HAD-IA family hydrolase [Lachnoclostridium sp.]